MKDGSLKSHLEAQMKLQRRFPEDFDLSRGFELAILLKGLEFRKAPDGPVLAGLESLQVEGAAISPATGGAVVKSLELSKPIGRLYKDKDGLHAMGFLVRTAAPTPATSQPAMETVEAAATAPAIAEAPQPAAPPPAAAPATRPAAEMRLDRLLVSGLDVVVEDRSTEPAVIVPLTGLDVEVRDLSNWCFTRTARSASTSWSIPARWNFPSGFVRVGSLEPWATWPHLRKARPLTRRFRTSSGSCSARWLPAERSRCTPNRAGG